jgi:hypothetical protein
MPRNRRHDVIHAASGGSALIGPLSMSGRRGRWALLNLAVSMEHVRGVVHHDIVIASESNPRAAERLPQHLALNGASSAGLNSPAQVPTTE